MRQSTIKMLKQQYVAHWQRTLTICSKIWPQTLNASPHWEFLWTNGIGTDFLNTSLPPLTPTQTHTIGRANIVQLLQAAYAGMVHKNMFWQHHEQPTNSFFYCTVAVPPKWTATGKCLSKNNAFREHVFYIHAYMLNSCVNISLTAESSLLKTHTDELHVTLQLVLSALFSISSPSSHFSSLLHHSCSINTLIFSVVSGQRERERGSPHLSPRNKDIRLQSRSIAS